MCRDSRDGSCGNCGRKFPYRRYWFWTTYQELPIEAPLHKVLSIALTEFPHGAALIVISRGEAPEQFARELVHNGVGHIRWDHLRFTFEETASLACSVPGIDEDTVRSLHAKANGWVAGTVLLLERVKANKTWDTPAPSDTMTRSFTISPIMFSNT